MLTYCRNNVFFNSVILARLGSTYGLYGYMKLFSFSEQKESIFSYKSLFIEDQYTRKKVIFIKWKIKERYFLVKIKNINCIKLAKLLVNKEIYIDFKELKKKNSSDIFWKEMIYCEIFNLRGEKLGVVVDLIRTGANDVFVVKSFCKENSYLHNEILIPCVDKIVVKNIDVLNKLIVVDWSFV